MSENKYTKKQRPSVVEQARIFSTKPGDVLHPPSELIAPKKTTEIGKQNEIWHLLLTIKTGLDKSSTSINYERDRERAEKFLTDYPVGKEIFENFEPFPLPFESLFERGAEGKINLFGAGDEDFGLCHEVLDGAGLRANYVNSAQKVLDWHGKKKCDWLEEVFAENWHVVAELEYCLNHFDRSSMAVVACLSYYNYFVANDDYAAGYYYRELELLNGGAEQLAVNALKRHKNAGRGGSKSSHQAKLNRLYSFLSEIEKLGDLFPRMSERSILDQAFENAIDKNATLWKQGKGRQIEYETELRSDSKFKDRYFKIFRPTA